MPNYEAYGREMEDAEKYALKGDPINALAAIWLAWRQSDLPADAKEQARQAMILANLNRREVVCPIEIDQALQNLKTTRVARSPKATAFFY